jgi:membrane-bound lytic murein transglycosylase D
MRPLSQRGSLVGILFIAALLAVTLSLAVGGEEGGDVPSPVTAAPPEQTPPSVAEQDEIIDPPLSIPSLLPDVISPAIAAPEYDASNSHFPRPPVLSANVDFWKRIYTEFGVGDFVLHDRDHLAIIYDVAHVDGFTNERRASDAAAPEIRRLRVKYEGILTSLAYGVAPETLGPDGLRVAQAWGCPCSSEDLRRAASNIRIQQGLREKVDEGMQRARALMPQILSVLRRHNLPHELAALPMVESSFNPRARSKAGAVGMWQITRSTGRRYLNITPRRDDRHDPARATDAAARLLKHNYGALGSWPLALLAYNHGKEGVRVAKETVGTSAVEDIIVCYNGRRFGFASRNFYPEFLAALDLLQPVIHTSAQQTPNLKRQSRPNREG